MKWFRQSIQRHRKSFLALLAVNSFFMVDGLTYVHAQELERQERERFLLDFSQTFGIPLEDLRRDRPSMGAQVERVVADQLVPWAASGSRQLEGLFEEFAEQLGETALLPSGGRLHATPQEPSSSGSSRSRREEPRSELPARAIVGAGKEQAKATSLAPEAGSPLRRLEKKARTVRGTASAARVLGSPARAPVSVPRRVVQKSGVAPEIVTLAESLGGSPGRIFRYVHDQIDFDPKWGAGKTALGTLQEGSGTSWEQAWLLQELLTAAGVDARFEWGEVQISTELLLGIAGVADPFRAGDLLTTAGMPIVLVVEGSQVVHARMSHAWVKAHLDYIPNRGATPGPGDTWIRMDPSLKRFDVSEGVRLDEAVPFVLGDYLESGTEESPREAYEAALQAHIDAQNLGVNLEQIKPAHAIVEEAFPFVPGTLRGKILSVAGESATMPESFQQQLAIEVREAGGAVLLNWTLPWPSAYGQRLELAWPGATSADQATLDLYGGVFQTPPYEVDLKPVLRLDGVDLVTGSDIGSAEDVVLRTTLTPPAGPAAVVPFELRAGERAIFAVDFGRTAQQTIDRHAAALAEATEASEQEAWGLALAAATYTRALAGDVEHLSLLRGLRRVQLGNVVLAVQRGGVSIAPDGTPLTFAIAPPAVDLGSMILGLFPADGVPATPEASVSTLELLGSQASLLEGAALAAALGGEHLTAVTSLTRAVREGQTLTRVDTANVDAALAAADLGEDAERSILAGVNGGKIAWIHQNQLQHETWDAAGYVLEDPATGAGGYFVTYERLLTGLDADISFHSPVDLDVITEPTDVVATIDSEHEITSWTLSYKAADGGDAVVLATGSGTVTNETLAELDPTLLLNGLYDLVLTARDALGQTASKKISVVVEGLMKVGQFTLEYVDLDLPVAGLDIEIVRSYDSRDKRLGDFGVGWTLEIRQGSLNHNRTPGEGWQIVEGFLPCEVTFETASHLTVVTLSELEVYRFTLELTSLAPTAGGCFAEARYVLVDGPVAGATLEILSNSDVFYANGSNELIDTDTLELFEPDRVRLRTRDGRSFELSLARGVDRIDDHNGNHLIFSDGTITHSSGKTATIDRDAVGRINRITDPIGHEIVYDYDLRGDLVSVTDQLGNVTRFTYDDNHRVLEVGDPVGTRLIRNDYDADGRLIRTTDAHGEAIELTHDIEGRRQVIRNRLGDVRILEYDNRGNVVREIDERGDETLRIFDGRDNLLSETAPLGRVTSMAYDAADNVTELTDPRGNKTLFTFNSDGQLLTRLDPRGGIQTHEYDGAGRLLRTDDPEGHRIDFDYDGFGELTQVTDGRGCVLDAGNNTDGLTASVQTAAGTGASYTYDANGNRTAETMVRSLPYGSTETLTTTFTYDAVNRPVLTTFPDGSTTEIRYNELGLETAIVDELGRETTFEYDPLGRRVRVSHPDGTTEEASYDKEGRRIASRDQAGRETRFVHDPTGNLIETVFPDGSRVLQTYDAAGRMITETDERGGVWRFEYDVGDNLTARVDPLGNRTTFTYDASGNQVSMTDANGHTVEFEYDQLNRRIRTVFDDGSADENIWDALGRLVAQIDQNGRRKDFEYDCAGRLIRVEDALNQVTAYAYDEAGNLISATDAEGRVTRFTHDRRGRVISHQLPLGQVRTTSYDALSRPTAGTDFNGNQTTFTYDDADRMIGKFHQGADSVTVAYTATGQRSSVTSSEGTWSFTYDSRDRLEGVTHPGGRTVAYTYDSAGNRTTIATDTVTTLYRFDAANRPIEIESSAGVNRFGYDPAGNRTSIEYANGTTARFLFDSLDRLTELTHRRPDGSMLASYVYSLDSEGNRLSVTEDGGRGVTYAYDELYRLVGETISDPVHGDRTLAYTFDRVGNRLTSTENGVATSYTYDANDRLLSAGSVSFDYDANGNSIRRTSPGGVDSYEYDRDDRLIRAEVGGRTVDLAYDNDGLRIRRTVDGTETTEFLYDSNRPLARVLAELNAAGNPSVEYVHGRELLSMERGGDVHTFHADAQGSVRQLTDSGATVAAEYGYDAFGLPLYENGSVANDYRYVGEPYDPDLGLSYLRARHYAPEQGRLLAADPVAGFHREPVTRHDFLYAGADPVNRGDPTGLFLSLMEVNVTASAQSQLRSRDARRGVRTLRRGFWGKRWDAYAVGTRMGARQLSLIRKLVPKRWKKLENHYFIYVNKRSNNRGLRYDVGITRLFPRSFKQVLPGIVTVGKTRLSHIRRDAARGPWWVGSFNRKQRKIWLWLTIPPGFGNGATEIIEANIKYSLSLDPILLREPGNMWKKITINCYNWTAYATGTALTATIIPIK